jgi:hypothetical protein
MPCTPPRTRWSHARTGWSGSARASGPSGPGRRTPASIPRRPRPRRGRPSWPRVSGAGKPCAASRRRPLRPSVVMRGPSRETGGTACSGRSWRSPALCSPSAWSWRCPRRARPCSRSARQWESPPPRAATAAAAARPRTHRVTRYPRRPEVPVRQAPPRPGRARRRPPARRALRRPRQTSRGNRRPQPCPPRTR